MPSHAVQGSAPGDPTARLVKAPPGNAKAPRVTRGPRKSATEANEGNALHCSASRARASDDPRRRPLPIGDVDRFSMARASSAKPWAFISPQTHGASRPGRASDIYCYRRSPGTAGCKNGPASSQGISSQQRPGFSCRTGTGRQGHPECRAAVEDLPQLRRASVT